MSELAMNLVAQVLIALTLGYKKDDLMLLLNKADLHSIASQEPNFFKATKTFTGEDRYFMGIQIKIMASKSVPLLVRRII